jgi:heme-degrading monooxygenase HmoA
MKEKNIHGYVAINYITCEPHYRNRFEELFKSRKRAIDEFPGFRNMYVLKPQSDDKPYLIISYWDNEDAFEQWTRSEAFIEGHRRGFADLKKAKTRGEKPPMTSEFLTYEIITD